MQFDSYNLHACNLLLLNLKIIVRNHLPNLYITLDIFPQITISVTYKRNNNLREILSKFLFRRSTKQNECSIEEYNRKFYNCKNFLVVSTDLTCFATIQEYKFKRILKCDSRNIIYLTSCKCFDIR